MKRLIAGLGILLLCASCDKPKSFATTVEILKIRRFGQDPKAAITEMELKFADCPGEAHKVIRAEKSFAECGAKLKKGDKVPADIVLTYTRDRGTYRSDFSRIDGCEVKIDAKDEANYELVQTCRPVVATGAEVGVHCDRTRGPELLAKCPFLRRR